MKQKTTEHTEFTKPSKPPKAKRTIALTGNIASGKSTVAKLLQQKGYAIIDGDQEAHALYQSNTPLIQSICEQFPEQCPHGSIDRQKLGELVFSHPPSLQRLNTLVKPVLQSHLQSKMHLTLQTHSQVVLDAALLFEWQWQDFFDFIIVVHASIPIRVQRLQQRNSLTVAQAQERIASQIPSEYKMERSHFVVLNEDTIENVEQQVHALHQILSE